MNQQFIVPTNSLEHLNVSTNYLQKFTLENEAYKKYDSYKNNFDVCEQVVVLQKGGDPAATSDTATLLRLSPSYRIYLSRSHPEG